MTKPITVAAAMTLVDEGKLALTDPIERWLPELADVRVLEDPQGPLNRTQPLQRAILVEDLLIHTSGLAYAFSVRGPLSRAYMRLPFNEGPDCWLAALGELPLTHQPGSRVTYSHSIDVLGVLVSRIDGKPLHQVLDERILQPLGMCDTGFHLSPDTRRRAATMYRLDDDDQLQHDVFGPARITPPSFPNAGGGLWSTADDYLRFIEMLLRGGVRDLSVVTDPAKSAPLFGPGGVGTFSWPGAYGTWWQADPAADLILLYLVQNFPVFSSDAAAEVAGNTSRARLQAALPKFVRRTYRALGL
jgi:CubicO group peptidase (beta-lactamase class C family)